MRKYKTTHKMYSAWNYEREIEDLNRMSDQGWQLVAGRMFSSRFKRNEDVCYRYQLDYRPKLDDRAGYIESFREFGWQYVNSTLNGWHYFRKPYDPSLPEDEYEIFTDRSSLQEMNSRWAKLGTGLLIFCSVVALALIAMLVYHPSLSGLALLLEYGIIMFFLARGVHIMRNPDRSKNRKGDVALTSVLLSLALLMGIGSVWLSANRANMHCTMSAEYMDAIPAELEDACLWNTFEAEYSDFAHIDVDIKADAPLTLTVVNEAGETVFAATGAEVSEDNIRVRLHRGEYRIYISDFEGGAMEVSFDL